MDPLNAFIGREAETSILTDALAAAMNGVPQFVLISGESGSGKSSLLATFAREYAWRGKKIRAFLLRPDDAGRYDPVKQAARETLGRAARGLADLRAAGQESEKDSAKGAGVPRRKPRRWAMAVEWAGAIPVVGNFLSAAMATSSALYRRRGSHLPAGVSVDAGMLYAASKRAPVVILLDDVHLLDVAAATELARMLDALPKDSRMLVVAAHTGVNDAIEILRGVKRGATRVELPPFTADEVAALVALRFRQTSHEIISDIMHMSGGNPRVVATVLERAGAGAGGGDVDWSVLHADDSVHASVDFAAFDALDEKTAGLLKSASLIGAAFDGLSLARSVSMDELAVEDILAVAVRCGLLRVTGEVVHEDGDSGTAYQFVSGALCAALRRGAR